MGLMAGAEDVSQTKRMYVVMLGDRPENAIIDCVDTNIQTYIHAVMRCSMAFPQPQGTKEPAKTCWVFNTAAVQ